MIERPADEGTPCWECRYGHGNCPEALYGAICIDYNMITRKEARVLENQRDDLARVLDRQSSSLSDYDEVDNYRSTLI